ncbi:phiSA1p31-related protein [Streptomyces griseus]|uniref:phiSA1p31-related protein n=1 Tax=Streptomyces griseus TaxID=1911 RepID=UPI0038275C16
MATAQYDTRTRTVEETVVVLTLTEDEADALREVIGAADGTRTMVRIFDVLDRPAPPEQPALAAETYTSPAGIIYDLSATYRDRSGDVWEFTGKRSAHSCKPFVTYTGYMDNDDTVDDIEAEWGPLTKVTP